MRLFSSEQLRRSSATCRELPDHLTLFVCDQTSSDCLIICGAFSSLKREGLESCQFLGFAEINLLVKLARAWRTGAAGLGPHPLKEISLRGVSGWTVMGGLALRVLESIAQRGQDEFNSRESVDLWEPSRSAGPCANHAVD